MKSIFYTEIKSKALAAQEGKPRVLLVSMPWANVGSPSIQLGILQACAQKAGFDCKVAHYNLDLAAEIGIPDYQAIATAAGLRLLGEWLFGYSLAGEVKPSIEGLPKDYLEFMEQEFSKVSYLPLMKKGEDGLELSFLEQTLGREYRKVLQNLRNKVIPSYLDNLAQEVMEGNFQIIGFTVTFNQLLASLALARRIKERCPECTILFGGNTLTDSVGQELHRAFPWINFIVYGEAEQRFVTLLNCISSKGEVSSIPAISYRIAGEVKYTAQAEPPEQIEYPFPNYDDYYLRVRDLEHRAGQELHFPHLPIYFEASRGCWWGRCTFCGLCSVDKKFRERSSEQVIEELLYLAARYENLRFQATDLVHGKSEFLKLVDKLAGQDLAFFWESRCSLSERLISKFAKAGIHKLQLGIESLSTPVLKLMKKGSTGIKNVEQLKLCRKHHIDVIWNHLYGFPGETEEDYRQIAALIPLIYHLQPPKVNRLAIVRNSYYHTHPEENGIRLLSPVEDYHYLFPNNTLDLNKFAMMFDGKIESLPTDISYIGRLMEAVNQWKEAYHGGRPAALIYRAGSDFLKILDRRQPKAEFITLRGKAASIYQFCDTVKHKQKVLEYLSTIEKIPVRMEEVEQILEQLVEARIMLQEGDVYLSLAIPAIFEGRPVVPDWRINDLGW